MSGDLAGNGWRWKWSLALLNIGVLGMTMALLVSGYEQSFIERALEGSTWSAYFQAQQTEWFMQGMYWRMVFGWVTAAGLVLLLWDMLTIGRSETRAIQPLPHLAGAVAG
jgi:nitric oxide reductase subunit B